MGVSLKDIAKSAGVSEATASLALNGRKGVNEKTKERVLEIAKAMGYVGSDNAKSLARRKSGLIGVMVPNISNLFYSNLVRHIERALRDMGYKMILVTTESNINYEKEMIKRFVAFRVEGAIIYPSIKENERPDYINILRQNSIPMVFIGSYYPGIEAPHVMSDLYHGVREAVDYLYITGCRHFYYIGGCKTIISNQLKEKAIRDYLTERGIEFPEDHYLELEHTRYENAYIRMDALLSSGKPVDAVIAADAFTSLAAYNVLRKHGYAVPEQVSIISFDNLLYPDICVTRLSCIEQDLDSIVNCTLQNLQSMIRDQSDGVSHLTPTKLILRDTTRQYLANSREKTQG
ncbi:MAG: LacI family DNA-binding transcriptional regulator [Clostridia bacterium]|nr:LacI family DNA-binding transcriptional regulator [Clostridia bacterium]